MSHRRLRAIPILFALLVVPAVAGPASAQPVQEPEGSDTVRAAARTLASKGIQLFEEGHYAEAYDHLERAQAVYPAPVHLVYMARAQAAMGKLLAARALYERVLAEPLAPDAAPAIRETRAAAQDEAAALRRRIPTLEVVVTGAPADRVRVSIDGAAGGKPSGRTEVDPGHHLIAASAEGSGSAKRAVAVREGESARVELQLGSEIQPTPLEPALPPGSPSAPQGSLVPAAIAFAIGGTALGVGAVTGAVSLSKVSDLKERCVATHCPVGDSDEASTARTLATLSTVGFVVAGLGVAAGVTLVIYRPSIRAAKAGSVVVAGAVPGGAVLGGRF